MPGGSADFLVEACIALRKLLEDVEQARSTAMELLGPCEEFDRRSLTATEVTELIGQMRKLQKDIFRIIGGGTNAAASVLKAKNVIRARD